MTKKDQYRVMMTGLMFAFGMAAQYQTVPALLFSAAMLAVSLTGMKKEEIVPSIVGIIIMEGYLLLCGLFFTEPVFILLTIDAVRVCMKYLWNEDSCLKTGIVFCAVYAVMRIIAMAVLEPSCTSILDLLFIPVAAGTAKQLFFAKRRHGRRRTTGVEYQL